MSATPSVDTTNVDINTTNGDHQGGFVAVMADRVRARAKELNFNASSLGTTMGLKSSAVANYWNGKRPWPTEVLPQMADALNTNVDFLLTGRKSVAVAEIADAEWEQVPLFDLRELTDTGKGEAVSWTPFRKDWLNRTLGTSFDLYLVKLLSGYTSRLGDRDLNEGDLVFCREITPAELADGYVCIFRRDQGLKVARVSLLPREPNNEDVITLGEVSDDQFVPVARILGRFLQRL